MDENQIINFKLEIYKEIYHNIYNTVFEDKEHIKVVGINNNFNIRAELILKNNEKDKLILYHIRKNNTLKGKKSYTKIPEKYKLLYEHMKMYSKFVTPIEHKNEYKSLIKFNIKRFSKIIHNSHSYMFNGILANEYYPLYFDYHSETFIKEEINIANEKYKLDILEKRSNVYINELFKYCNEYKYNIMEKINIQRRWKIYDI